MKKAKIREKASKTDAKCWRILKTQAAEFCRETGLHGYKYIGQTQRSKAERIIWAMVVLVSLCCALALIEKVWNYFATHPTLTIIESTHHDIWNYPFPAITICDFNRMSYNLTKKFVENLKIPANISKEYLIKEMRLMNELIVPGVFGKDVKNNLTRLQNIIDDNRLSILEVMSSPLQVLLLIWIYKDDPTCVFFKNRIDKQKSHILETSAACGYETGMTVVVNPEPNDYHSAIIGAYGVKVMVHYSFDYPDFNAEIQMVRLNSQHFVSLNPAEMYSKREVKNLAISTRQCIFSEEADNVIYRNIKDRNLTFVTYSYHNCMAECRASIVKMKCGCIPYYFPQNSTRVCNLNDVECLKTYKEFLDSSWPVINQDYQYLPKTTNNIKGPCGCIPDCNLYRYPVESSSGILDPTIYYNDGNFTKNPRNAISIENRSVVHVFFNDLVAFQYQRSVNYSWRNLFASFGGLLGLFAGFSLMSIFEFLYFFVIRVITNIYIHPRRYNNVQ